ncbi:MAG: DUF2723 domain-containing protein [Labilithrix sp.]|nr:DUF2723 domain-containing protein [Labilithrix sp.]
MSGRRTQFGSRRELDVGEAGARAVVFLAAVWYVATAARTVQGGDSGELAALAEHGGVAHPPGYPLYVLWLRVTAWLPATSPAHRAALATAVLGAASVLALQHACRRWGATSRATFVASALYATSPLAWRLSTEPEVFSLNVLIAMLIVAYAAPHPAGETPTATGRVATLALLAGVGIANHHSIVLLAPVGIYGAVRNLAAARRRVLAVFIAIAAFVGGLSPYIYVVWITRSTPLDRGCVRGAARDLAGLLHHFLRAEYGTTRLGVSDAAPETLAQLAHLGGTLLRSGIGPLLLLAIIGWATSRPRWSWRVVVLVLSFVSAGPAFVAQFNLPPRGLSALVVERFHLLPLAIAAVVGSLGFSAVERRLRKRGVINVATALGGLAACTSLVVSGSTYPDTIELYLKNVFAMLPPRAILIASSDDQVGGFEYMQCALDARPDVDVISPHLLLTPWYAARVSARVGFEVVHGEPSPPRASPVLQSSRLVEQLLTSGRPLFITRWFAHGLEQRYASYPIGPVIRVVGDWSAVPSPRTLYDSNVELFNTLTLGPRPPRGSWSAARLADYGRTWTVLARALEETGAPELAADCRERAATFDAR